MTALIATISFVVGLAREGDYNGNETKATCKAFVVKDATAMLFSTTVVLISLVVGETLSLWLDFLLSFPGKQWFLRSLQACICCSHIH